MEDNNLKWVEDLQRVHNELPVDQALKEKLRGQLLAEIQPPRKTKKNRLRLWGSITAVAATAAIILLVNFVAGPTVTHVNAAALQLQLQFNTSKMLGHDPSASAAIDGSVSYYAIPEQGIYRQQELSYTRLVNGNTTELALAPSGKQLAYIIENEIFVLDVASSESRLVAAAPKGTPLSSLSWASDESKIAYTKYDAATNMVMEADLRTGEQRFLAKGIEPSYISDGKQLLYEKYGTIVKLDLETKETTNWAEGRAPRVSPDGQYVLYVRTNGDMAMEDVWIADLDRQSEQQVTHNEAIDAWENGELKEGKQQPYFHVGNMTWSRDGQQIGIYQIIETNAVSSQFVRYTLSTEALEPADVVGKSIEALIYRDERYAHSFFSYDPGYLKGTSPRQVGYSIVDQSQDEQGRWIITANVDYAYQFPFYSVSTMRFVVTKHLQGEKGMQQERYLIDDMQGIDSTTITTWGDDEIVRTENDQLAEPIFKFADVPQDKGWVNDKFEHMVYREVDKQRQIWFLVQQHEEGNENSKRHRLLRYNWDEKTFQPLAEFARDGVSVMMIVNAAGNKAAITIEQEGKASEIAIVSWQEKGAGKNPTSSVVYLSELLQTAPYADLNTRLWKEDSLSFFVEWEDRDVFMEYHQ
ncbi:hypothetical protein [Paenibacillus sp. GCM10027626]|uniref:hypothetical protein n=1 Tax=Paenibacillus sp. GCM10027626 TaxID=3273411 RepID=UPI0036396EF3